MLKIQIMYKSYFIINFILNIIFCQNTAFSPPDVAALKRGSSLHETSTPCSIWLITVFPIYILEVFVFLFVFKLFEYKKTNWTTSSFPRVMKLKLEITTSLSDNNGIWYV